MRVSSHLALFIYVALDYKGCSRLVDGTFNFCVMTFLKSKRESSVLGRTGISISYHSGFWEV